MYDSHTHLNSPQLFPNREQHLDDFINQGGKGLVNVGSDRIYNQQAIIIAEKFNELKASNIKGGENNLFKDFFLGTALGYHPFEIVELSKNGNNEGIRKEIKNMMEELKQQYATHKDLFVAVGEAGIDLHYDGIDQDNIVLQKELLGLHCDLAQELRLPLIIHSRDGFDQTLDVVQNYKDLTIYFHCWSYRPEEISKLQNMFSNLYIGFCCNTMYPKAQNLRDSLQVVDRQRLLLETDAPYLPPQKLRGELNYPKYILYLYEYIAQFLDMQQQDLFSLLEKNFHSIYYIK